MNKSVSTRITPYEKWGGTTVIFTMGACVMYYIFITISCPGDFQGDSWEYLSRAAQIRTDGSTSYSYLRGIVYPWLLALTWGSDGLLTYVLQGSLFIGALYAAIRVLAFGTAYAILPIVAAMLPAVTFLQKQVYPDGVLTSLTLLFFVAVARKRWLTSVAIALVLALTKLVFIVILSSVLAAFLIDRKLLPPKWPIYAVLSIVLLGFPAIALFDYATPDLAYRVLFERPYAHGYPLDRIFPTPELSVDCGGRTHRIARQELDWGTITIPTLAPYGPLTEAQVEQLGCTGGDLHAMKRRLMTEYFLQNPMLHIRWGLWVFLRGLGGGYDSGHISYILYLREQAWLNHFTVRSYFEEYEQVLLNEYKKKGIGINQARPLIFTLSTFGARWGETLIRLIALCTMAACGAIAYRRRHLSLILEDPVTISIGVFLLVYAFCISISVPVSQDRYLLLSLLLICILASRFAALILEDDRLAVGTGDQESTAVIETTTDEAQPPSVGATAPAKPVVGVAKQNLPKVKRTRG